jgi:hypothetical protein
MYFCFFMKYMTLGVEYYIKHNFIDYNYIALLY